MKVSIGPFITLNTFFIHCYRAGGVDPKSKSKKHVAGWLIVS